MFTLISQSLPRYPDIHCVHGQPLFCPPPVFFWPAPILMQDPLWGGERMEPSISIFLKSSLWQKSFLASSLNPFLFSKWLKESKCCRTSSQKFLMNICLWWFVTSVWKFISVVSWCLRLYFNKCWKNKRQQRLAHTIKEWESIFKKNNQRDLKKERNIISRSKT